VGEPAHAVPGRDPLLPPGTREPPGAPPRPWRRSGRLLVLDPHDRLLLLHARDPYYPELGPWWEVPGGGVDPGEDTVAAAVREVAEETGVVVPRARVGPAAWRVRVTSVWLGRRRWAEQVVHLAVLDAVPAPDGPVAYTDEELATFVGVEWVPLDALPTLPRSFPDGLVDALPELRAGRDVDDGFRVWS
jgi:8-oxo-dGTP pyrophosphatase MutT (NUDIX family)